MKRIIFAIVSVAAIFTSCEWIVMEGGWDPIEVDKKHVDFPSEGGQNTVSTLNYTRWWINCGYGATIQVDGHWKYIDFIHATSSVEGYVIYDILEGGWYHVVVPDKGKSNSIIITVDPNESSEPRTAVIQMTVGDAFTSISISQQ